MDDLNLAEVLDSATLGFNSGPVDLVTTVRDGRLFAYVLSQADYRITAVELTSGGWSVIDTLSLSGDWRVGAKVELSVVSGGILVGGLEGPSLVTLDAAGRLVAQGSAGALVDPAAATDLGGDLTVTSRGRDGGLDLWRGSGAATGWAGTLADSDSAYLAEVVDVASLDRWGETWLFTASRSDSGVTALRLEPGDSLAVVASLGAADALPIGRPEAIAAVALGAEIGVVVASSGSSSVTVLRFDAAGDLVLADHVLDTARDHFAGASLASAASYGDFSFVAVAGSDGGVTLLTVLPTGRLQRLSGFADREDVYLYRPTGLDLAVIGATLQLSASSLFEGGMTRLTLDLSTLGQVITAPPGGAALTGTDGDDQIAGSDVGDTLVGGAGDDIIFDGSGLDLMTGGPGADLFVFELDGQEDRIEDFEPGIDSLDLSSIPFLYDVSQLEITPTAEGATLRFGGETITLVTFDRTPLTADALDTDDILDLDRAMPPGLGQDLEGGDEADVISGAAGDDTIRGGGGDDSITGGAGDDTIVGEDGADSLSGGEGDDAIRGGAGNDRIDGGDGSDLLLGDGAEDWSDLFDWGGV